MSVDSTKARLSFTQELSAWWQIWKTMYLNPTPEAYETVLQDAQAGTRRAMTWTALTIFVSYGILLIPAAVIFIGLAINFVSHTGGASSNVLPLVICALIVPILMLLGILGLLFSVGVYHVIARVLGGTGKYFQLWYLFSAYMLPFIAVYLLVAIIPFMNMIAMIVAWYAVYMQAVAVKAVHRLSWAKTWVVIAIPILFNLIVAGLFLLLYIAVVFSLMTSGSLPGIFQHLVPNLMQSGSVFVP